MRQRISEKTTVVAAKDQVSANLTGEVAILHLKSGIYYGLNAVGARVWNFIRVPKKVSEIRDLLLAEYGTEPERCWSDLLKLLTQLMDEGLVDVKDDSSA